MEVHEMEIFNQTFELREDEYLKDGLIYCKNCNTPRQCFVEKNVTFRCACECRRKKYEEEEERKRLELEIERLKALKKNSLLGKRYENSTFETLDRNRPESFLNAVKRCEDYCNKWQEVKEKGLGLYIFGDVGTGKTELSACIVNCLLSKLVPVLITNFLEISKRIRASYNIENETEESIILKFANIDFLILDDLGVENIKNDSDNSFLQEKIFDIVNLRYINKRPTIFTSNYSIEKLLKEKGLQRRIVERIADMSNARFELRGESYRNGRLK